MDTSETYIKMCEKAEEIQKIWSEIDCSLLPSFIYDTVTKSVAIMIWTPNKLAEIIRRVQPSQGNSLIASIECLNDKNIGYEDKNDSWRTNTIWLPRQDQLQEMLLEPLNTLCPDILTMLRLLNVFASVNPQFTSMEQLWLAFVMKEKFSKMRNGEDWV